MLALLGGGLWTGLNTISVKCFLLMKTIHSGGRKYKIIIIIEKYVYIEIGLFYAIININ